VDFACRRLARVHDVGHVEGRSCGAVQLIHSIGIGMGGGPKMRATIIGLSLAFLATTPALAGRPVTDQERTKLEDALKAQGCSGGKMEFDDGKFEVDDATCADGKKYDLDFDKAFALTKKKLD
jgi:hypothetical protein